MQTHCRAQQCSSIVNWVMSTPPQWLWACVPYTLLWISYTLFVEKYLESIPYGTGAHTSFPISCILILYLHSRIRECEKKDEGTGWGYRTGIWENIKQKKHWKYQDCQEWTLLSLQEYHTQEWSIGLIQQMLLHMLHLLVRSCVFDAHFSMEADICDPDLTPISVSQKFVQNQNINIYPL